MSGCKDFCAVVFQTIFYDLPRLASVTCEEWIPTDLFTSCGVSGASHIELENSNRALKQFSVAAWVLKTSGECRDNVKSLRSDLHNSANIAICTSLKLSAKITFEGLMVSVLTHIFISVCVYFFFSRGHSCIKIIKVSLI
jgi:hypothetical protein